MKYSVLGIEPEIYFQTWLVTNEIVNHFIFSTFLFNEKIWKCIWQVFLLRVVTSTSKELPDISCYKCTIAKSALKGFFQKLRTNHETVQKKLCLK